MKIIFYTVLIIFLTMNLYADKNWIEIESNTKSDVELSQKKPINQMMQNITVVKGLIDGTRKKEKVNANDKNWFSFNNESIK